MAVAEYEKLSTAKVFHDVTPLVAVLLKRKVIWLDWSLRAARSTAVRLIEVTVSGAAAMETVVYETVGVKLVKVPEVPI